MRAAWWWIDRWRKSTAYTDLTLEEQGAYRNLLDELWLRNGVLPNNERILAKICGDALAWARVRDVVLARFTLTADGWRNGTHDEVMGQGIAFRDRQREKGLRRAEQAHRQGGRFQPAHQPDQPEHQPDDQPKTSPTGKPETSLPSPSPSPSPITVSVSDCTAVAVPAAVAAPIRRAKGSALPPDDQPLTDAGRTFALTTGIQPTRIDAEWAQFVDHHRAKGSVFKDWAAAWRTWCRNAVKFARSSPGYATTPELSDTLESIRKISEERAHAQSRSGPTARRPLRSVS